MTERADAADVLRVLAALKAGPASAGVVAARAGLHRHVAYLALRELERRGAVVFERVTYRVADPPAGERCPRCTARVLVEPGARPGRCEQCVAEVGGAARAGGQG